MNAFSDIVSVMDPKRKNKVYFILSLLEPKLVVGVWPLLCAASPPPSTLEVV